MTHFNRRHFFSQQAFGIGGLAMASLMKQEGLRAAPAKPPLQRRAFDLEPRRPVYRPQATAMISMFMQGGPSHMDLCDPKPELAKHHMKSSLLAPGNSPGMVSVEWISASCFLTRE